MYLADFEYEATSCRENEYGFESFRQKPNVLALQWPNDVLEQWLYDHAGNSHFQQDYGTVDLTTVTWRVEVIDLNDLLVMPTGPSDADVIDQMAENPGYRISVRDAGVHLGVAQCWETHGTWKRWPIIINRLVLEPSASGLQLIEGRTRVGVLRGRHREGSFVAQKHLAWVGSSATATRPTP